MTFMDAYVPGGGITHGFLYGGGVFTTLDVPGADHTEAEGINKTSEIVGFTYDITNTFQPFLLYVSFTGINDAGQIVGNTDSVEANGLLPAVIPNPWITTVLPAIRKLLSCRPTASDRSIAGRCSVGCQSGR